jgi:hypothetical protein
MLEKHALTMWNSEIISAFAWREREKNNVELVGRRAFMKFA